MNRPWQADVTAGVLQRIREQLPDAVLRPIGSDQVAAVLTACASAGVRVIPWGGGTSVTGGVNVVAGDAPVVSLDLDIAEPQAGIDETDLARHRR